MPASQKKGIIIALISCVLLLALAGCAKSSAPVKVEASFSQDALSQEGWSAHLWMQDADITWDAGTGHDAPGSMKIAADADNDARLVWTVKVEPKSTYMISCWVRTEDVGYHGAGANISLLELTCRSYDISGTNDWRQIVWYGITGPGQRTLNLTLGLGGYASANTGTVWFDDAAVEKVKEVPAGTAAEPLYVQDTTDDKEGMPVALGIGFVLAAILFAGLIFMLIGYRKDKGTLPKQTKGRQLFWVLLGGGLILRIALAAAYPGLSCDTGCFQGWTWTAGQDLFHFYENTSFSDYPPLYIYILGVMGGLARLFGITPGMGVYTVLVKLPGIAADLLAAVLLYRYGTRKKDERLGLTLMALYILNPAIWVNSTLWGQVDGVLTLWLILFTLAVERRNLHHAAAWLAVAVLTKPQGLLLAPILLFAWIREGNVRNILRSVLWGAGAFLLIIFPFAVQHEPLWIFTLLKGTTSQYAYASFNAYNLFSLLGANLTPDTDTLLFIPYKIWGMILMAASVLYAGYVYLRKREYQQRVWLAALVLVAGVYVLGFRMHERYLYPAVALACFWAAGRKGQRGFGVIMGFSITVFANTFQVLVRDAMYGGYMHIPPGNLLLRAGSLLNCILLGYIVYLTIAKEKEITENGLPVRKEPPKPSFSCDRKPLTKKDIGIISLLTGVYLIVALLNLGGFDAPRSCWTAESRGETVEITLTQKTELSAFSWYGRLGGGSFRVSAANDTGQYVQIATFESNAYPDFGKWRHAEFTAPIVTDRVRVTAEPTGVEIAEMGWFDTLGRTVPAVATDPMGPDGTLHPIADEQDRVAYYHTYMAGTYFDEIYHVRTAYEQMIHVQAYEYTHPPLGKIIISAGISLFGMTPFGWRLPGTIFGAAMIPLMYAFGYELFGRRRWALFAALLMALDFMHFTQTRMATVDTYTVFFTIFMFYFMYRYIRKYEEGHSFGYGLTMLCLCGISFGLGGASKWSALYGATGLAFLYFWDMCRRSHEPAPAVLGGSRAIQSTVTILASLGFFILIPAAIYTMSYIPFFQVPGPGHGLTDMIILQKSMYHYHSTLVATHDFASPWWSWPLDGRPLWLYVGEGTAQGMRSTLVSMGNPLIWWAIIPAMVAAGVIGWRYRDRRALFLLVAIVSQYLPWILISRISFIYHFFPILPFGMLAIVYAWQMLSRDHPWMKKAMWWYLGVCLFLFLWFYPALSGLAVPEGWIKTLRWIPSVWYF